MTEETTTTLFHGGDTFTCDYHPKTKIPTLSCIKDSKTGTAHANMLYFVNLTNQPHLQHITRI
jgi:hypothetical protein